MDIQIAGLDEGHLVEVYVHAVAGVTKNGDTALVYHASSPAVTFTCNGTTLNFECKLNGNDAFDFTQY
jgi:hypothetical protein